MKYFSILVFIFFISNTNIFAEVIQDTVIVPPRMLHPTDTLEVIVKGENRFLLHRVKPKQTLYAIAKYYGLEASDLMYYNEDLINGIETNQIIKIPISSLDLKTYKTRKEHKWRMIEVVYQVKPKDTVYKIAKTKFKMSLDTFRLLNNMTHDTLEIGKKVMVGWIDINGIPPKIGVRAWLPVTLYDEFKTLKNNYWMNSQKEDKVEVVQKGIAVWNKNQNTVDLFALHKTAPVGTILQVRNPLNDRIIYVKVIGEFQTAGHRYDAILFLSTGAADALGGINKNFRVEIHYYK
jgi:LysM repeat protein